MMVVWKKAFRADVTEFPKSTFFCSCCAKFRRKLTKVYFEQCVKSAVSKDLRDSSRMWQTETLRSRLRLWCISLTKASGHQLLKSVAQF